MQIRSDSFHSLNDELATSLATVRRLRNFNADAVIQAKIALLTDYMRYFGLKACVIALSGGVDSAVVYALARKAAALSPDVFQKVVGINLPYAGSTPDTGVTRQASTTDLSFDLSDAIDGEGEGDVRIYRLDAEHLNLTRGIESMLGIRGNAWSRGQIASTLRTSALSYACTLLTKQGSPAVLLGTTNRDEGGYLGYFGKYSDGAVDLQLISDLHKSEVYAIARALGVPSNILDAVPTGDMFDEKTDEEVFGVSYDFVELHAAMMAMNAARFLAVTGQWSADTRALNDVMHEAVEAMHRYNGHKYLGRSPAVHLDVLEAAVKDGWDNRPRLAAKSTDPTKFVGLYQPKLTIASIIPLDTVDRRVTTGPKHTVVHELLNEAESEALIRTIPPEVWIPVGIDGIKRDTPPDVIGSYRASLYDTKLAETIWDRLRPHMASVRTFDQDTVETDWDGHPVWKPIGINPLFRFIRYKEGGKLVPHYDGPRIENTLQRSLMSLVIYLDTPANGEGVTRFIIDPQDDLPLHQRNLDDWTRDARDNEVACRVAPSTGNALLFDHRVLHDSEAIGANTTKTIVRTDIMFERADWYRD